MNNNIINYYSYTINMTYNFKNNYNNINTANNNNNSENMSNRFSTLRRKAIYSFLCTPTFQSCVIPIY